ncbi:hypothetical protein LXA43DRAFT_1021183 [Ganoderma leucocontextum]|nr:hypothetical protein LXA43DRAFT_1021183 [Ganoderma leucocontextum]
MFRARSEKADVFIFPPAVTPSPPDRQSPRRWPPTQPPVRKRTEGGRGEVCGGTFNEWMNLLSSRTQPKTIRSAIRRARTVEGRRIRIESFGIRLSTRRLPSLSEAELIKRFIIQDNA